MKHHTQINPVMGLREWGLILILSVIWGASFFFVEVAVTAMSPLSIVLCRVGLAAAALWAFILATGRSVPRSLPVWGGLILLGGLNNVAPFFLIAWGQIRIESGTASILNAFAPVFSVILAHFFTGEERLTPGRLAGVLLGWAGVGILMGGASLAGDFKAVAGQAAVLGAALCYACAAIFARRFKDLDPVTVAAGMLTGSTVITLALALMTAHPLSMPTDVKVAGAITGLALISTSLAYIIYFKVLARAGATNILLVTFLIPISAVFLGVTFLDESLGGHVFLGMTLIFAGLAAIDGRMMRRIRPGDSNGKKPL